MVLLLNGPIRTKMIGRSPAMGHTAPTGNDEAAMSALAKSISGTAPAQVQPISTSGPTFVTPEVLGVESAREMDPARIQAWSVKLKDALLKISTMQVMPVDVAKARIDRWVDTFIDVNMERFRGLGEDALFREGKWLARRLTGLPGSAIGDAVSVMRRDLQRLYGADVDAAWSGDFDGYTFKTPRDIVADALLLATPEPPTVHTTRGHRREPELRARFLAKFGAESLTDIVKGAASHRHRQHRWLIGNPDEFARLADGSLAVVDYKAPTAATIEHYRVHGAPLRYIAQLHDYKLLIEDYAAANGIDLPPLRLLIVMDDVKSGDILVQEVPYDEDLSNAIIEAGDYLWEEYVLKNQLPPHSFAGVQQDDFDLEIPDEIVEAGRTYVAAKQAAEVFKAKADEAGTVLTEWASEIGYDRGVLPDGVKIKAGLATLSFDTALDVDGALLRLKQLGGDPEAVRAPGSVDEKALTRALEDIGKQADKFLKDIAKGEKSKTTIETLTPFLQSLQSIDIPHAPGKIDPAALVARLSELGGDPSVLRTLDVTLRAPAITHKNPEALEASRMRDLARGHVGQVLTDLGSSDVVRKPVSAEPELPIEGPPGPDVEDAEVAAPVIAGPGS